MTEVNIKNPAVYNFYKPTNCKRLILFYQHFYDFKIKTL